MPRHQPVRTPSFRKQQRSRVLHQWFAGVGALMLAGTLVVAPGIAGQEPAAKAASGNSVYIDEPLQGEAPLTGWSLSGDGNVSDVSGNQAGAWLPQLSTISENNNVNHSINTNNCGFSTGANQWPRCLANKSPDRDGKWMTLTTDNTNANSANNNGGAQAGTALNNTPFKSDLGVVLEYDQRLYRTNDGRIGGSPAIQGGGDGLAVYLADANGNNYGNSGIDTSVGEAGGYGAGLGYSAVSYNGDNLCPAAQGVAGGYIGVGFDVYGNYQKAENTNATTQYNRATRPWSVAQSNPAAFADLGGGVTSARIPQSIGLRGSGVRYTDPPACDPAATGGMNQAFGLVATNDALVTQPGNVTVFQPKWDGNDTAADYKAGYNDKQSGTWVNLPQSAITQATAAQLPAGLGDPKGYVMLTVPAAAAPFDLWYTRKNVTAGANFVGINGDAALGKAPSYTPLKRTVGGYRWLAGTNNLSSAPNPTNPGLINDNAAARQGAVIDNAQMDSTKYRRVRITLTPKADGSRSVKVYWTDKLNVSDDKCYTPAGVEITGVGANGSSDSCISGGGTWHHGQPYAFNEQFSYDVASSSYQAELPTEFKLGFSASTGWAVNYHQIRNVRVTSVVDLAVDKTVQATGAGSSIDDGAWADETQVNAGEKVAYKIDAWNNGISDLDDEYPASLVDGLDQVPFDDLANVAWTATATGDAKVCTTWNTATVKCDAYGTTLSGTGALTDAAPLRWAAASRTHDPTANINVVFTGTVGASTGEGSYPNTAVVATSRVGGPQEDDFSNNKDDALITVLPHIPQWTLGKAAEPASGSLVGAGETIEYTVSVEALDPEPIGTVAGVSVVDNLAEVLQYAEFEAGSVLINGAAPAAGVTVTEPVPANNQTLTVAGLNLPAATTTPITYKVTVKDPAASNVSFRNYVLGVLADNPPVQCAADSEADYLANCSTIHHTPSLLQVLKVGEDSTGATIPFEGSEWAIYPDDNGAPAATPVVEFGPEPKSPEIGTGLFQAQLAPGSYWLAETKALDGFNLLPGPVAFTVAADGTVTLAGGNTGSIEACAVAASTGLCQHIPADNTTVPTIVVQDVPILALPETGGLVPPWLFYAAGVLMVALTGTIAVVLIRRRRDDA